MKGIIVVCLAIIAALSVHCASAEELPLWEAGVGFTGLNMPDYRGSDEQRAYLFPIPYVVYRGDILRWDRKGIYGLLFASDRIQLNLSADASVPVKSDRNAARNGMPDLDTTVQIGPSLEICIYRPCNDDQMIQFRTPVRAVLATDLSHVRGIGFIANPQLNFDFKLDRTVNSWNFGFAFGPLFATTQYHRFYYDVQPQYASPGVRAEYQARGGYSGSMLVLALSRRFENVWFGLFGRIDELSRAAFVDSPLVRKNHSFMAGFGLAWVFGKSEVLVSAYQ